VTELALPDLPRWVEAHGIARDPEGWRRDAGAGFALGHDRAALIVVAGDAEADAVSRLATEHPGHTLLVASERDDLAAALRERALRDTERAILHELRDPAGLPDTDGVLPLGDAPLDHVPAALATELGWARSRGPVWAAWVDGRPVSFAYAPWRSPRWFDVSVDTLQSARQLGLATLVASAMIRDERTHGREPVWGADEANTASRRLARRLGFAPVDEIWVAASHR
jgi:hypothetical protein